MGFSMFLLLNALLAGIASGLRALIGLAVVSWAARLGYLHLDHTWLSFLADPITPYVVSLMAIGELVNDKLPKTGSRKLPGPFITRVVTGSLCGVALGIATQQAVLGLAAGAIGSVVGTLGGAKARGSLAGLFGCDLPAALLEDVVALGLALFAVLR